MGMTERFINLVSQRMRALLGIYPYGCDGTLHQPLSHRNARVGENVEQPGPV